MWRYASTPGSIPTLWYFCQFYLRWISFRVISWSHFSLSFPPNPVHFPEGVVIGLEFVPSTPWSFPYWAVEPQTSVPPLKSQPIACFLSLFCQFFDGHMQDSPAKLNWWFAQIGITTIFLSVDICGPSSFVTFSCQFRVHMLCKLMCCWYSLFWRDLLMRTFIRPFHNIWSESCLYNMRWEN